MTSHNDYPATQNPQVEFLPQDLQRLEAFAGGLREAYYHSQGNEDQLQHMVESQIDADVHSVQGMPAGQGEAIKLAITASALGATHNHGKAQMLHQMVLRNELLSEEDKNVLSGYANGLWNHRSQGIPEGEISMAVYQQGLGDMTQLSIAETPGDDKSALKIAIMGFALGATVRLPEYNASVATSLVEEARRHAA